jgi:hypothetical protein
MRSAVTMTICVMSSMYCHVIVRPHEDKCWITLLFVLWHRRCSKDEETYVG